MRRGPALTLVAVLATASLPAWPAEAVLDQANYPLTNSDGNLEIHEGNPEQGAGRHFVAQTFTVGTTGRLARVDLPVKHHRCTPVGQLRVDILSTVDGVPGDVTLASASVGPDAVPASEYGLVAFDLGAGANVTAGDVLTLAVTTDAAYPCNYAWDGEFNGEFNEFGSDYAGGKTWCFYGMDYMTDACWRDMGFQTWLADADPDSPPGDDDGDSGENDDDQGDNRDDGSGNSDDQRGNDDGQGQDQEHAGARKAAATAGAMGWPSLLLALMAAGLRRRRGAARSGA